MSASLESSRRKRPRSDPADPAGKASKKLRKSPEPPTSRNPNGEGANDKEKSKKSKASGKKRDRAAVNGTVKDDGEPNGLLKHAGLDRTAGDAKVVALSKKENGKSKELEAAETPLPKAAPAAEKMVAKRKEPSWSWTASEPLCGQFLEQDPIFSRNEKFVS
jgi:hypothetical protein